MQYQTMPLLNRMYYAAKLKQLKDRMKSDRCKSDPKLAAFNCPVCARAYQATLEELKSLSEGENPWHA